MKATPIEVVKIAGITLPTKTTHESKFFLIFNARKVLKSEDLYVKTYKVMCCSHSVRIKLTARMTEK